ncbi:MAG: TldD/PmbA family protein [Chloroflexi bacterium]|jgi:TldD protein|nr:TldD/PmbA family protein [Chloroflexota bacterium]
MDREQIMAALKASRADYTEIRLETRRSTKVIFHGRHLETADVTLDQGGIVRSLVRNGGWGIATFNDLGNLAHRVDQAYQSARVVQGEPVKLAETQPVQDEVRVALATDFRQIPLEQKKEIAERYNDILLSGDRIIDTQAIYSDTFSTVIYANSEGAYIVEERPMAGVHLLATARDGNNVQRAADGLSLPTGYEEIQDLDALAREVAQRATDLLSAETVVGGVYPVICNPKLAGVFVHEAFGHLSEADFVYSNPQAQEMMVLGRRFGRDILTIVDDGTLPGLRGTHPYDDEGTPTQRTELVREGVLVGRLHSRETAGKMGEQVTGNARATGYRYPPIVRMTNTFIEPRDASFDEMIRDIKLGVYACDAIGGQTMLENFSFSAAYAYMIRDGQIAEMVKDVILGGNLFTTLQNIDAIGSDLTFSKLGTCGKGQGGLPVSTGSPHIRIQNVAMGGR